MYLGCGGKGDTVMGLEYERGYSAIGKDALETVSEKGCSNSIGRDTIVVSSGDGLREFSSRTPPLHNSECWDLQGNI